MSTVPSADRPIVAFVAGATGYTGHEVVKTLADRGAKVVAHIRPDSERVEMWRERFSARGVRVDTTPWEADSMARTLSSLAPTHVFALLGTTKKRASAARRQGQEAGYEAVDFGLTVMLLQASVQSGSRPRFVYLSAMGAKTGAWTHYMQVRGRVEERVQESSLPFTILRPSFITGSDREETRPAERTTAAAFDGVLAVVGALGGKRVRARYRAVTGPDLARALVSHSLDPRAENRVLLSDEIEEAG